jgi:ABC-type multidrug transport system fused ATPase/permease subunit
MTLGLWVGLKRRLNWHVSKVWHFQQFLPIESALWKQILYHRRGDLGLPKDEYLATQCVAAMIAVCLQCSVDFYLPLVLRTVVEKLSRQEVAWREIVILGALRFAVSRAALQGMQRALSTRISHHFHQSFKAFCYSHIMDLSADYHLSTPMGESMTAISWGGSLIDSWLDLVFSALPLIADLTTALFAVGLLFPPVTLGILVATMAFLVALNGIWVTQNVPKHQMANARRRNQELHIMNTLLCWRTVSECRKISVERQRHGAKSETYRKGLQELDDSALILDAGQDMAILVGFLAACSYISEDISKAHLNPLPMLTLLMYWS